jgi:DNA-binding NarL/FixJ family response regulator
LVRPSVLIVDDHRRFRASARALLESAGFDVVGEAADGEGALREVATLRPGLVLLDIQLPDRDGFAVAEALAAAPSPPDVILISSRDAADYGERVGQAPVRGFVAKSELSGESIHRLLA